MKKWLFLGLLIAGLFGGAYWAMKQAMPVDDGKAGALFDLDMATDNMIREANKGPMDQ